MKVFVSGVAGFLGSHLDDEFTHTYELQVSRY